MAIQPLPTGIAVVNHLLAQAQVAQESRMPALTEKDRTTIDRYTNPKNEDSVIHRMVSVWDSRPLKLQLAGDMIKGITLGAAAGAAAGGLVGSVAILLNKISFIVTPVPSLIRSMFIGAVCGGAVGGVVASVNNIVTLTESPVYVEWKRSAIPNKVLPLFREFMQRADIREDFICPLSHDIIQTPVSGEDGRTYELFYINQWLEAKEREYPAARLAQMAPAEREAAKATFSPVRGAYFTRANLHFKEDYHKNLFNKIRVVFNQEVDAQVQAGLLAYQNAVLQTRVQIGKHLGKEVTDLYMASQISQEQLLTTLANVKRLVELDPLISVV